MKTLLVAIALLLPAAAPADTLSIIVDGARVHASEKTAVEAAEAMFTPAKTGGPYEFPGLGIYAGERSGTLAPLVPNSRVVGIPGTGHLLMLEKPAEFNKLLADFL